VKAGIYKGKFLLLAANHYTPSGERYDSRKFNSFFIKTENALENVPGDIGKLVSSKMKRVLEKNIGYNQCAPSHEC
jgi:hypothetical protein